MATKQEKPKVEKSKPVPAAKSALKPATRRATAKKTTELEITEAMIAERAFYIALTGEGSTDAENWHRAEAELRNGKP
jgi:hypothetical protein